jgi:hypothetical protein
MSNHEKDDSWMFEDIILVPVFSTDKNIHKEFHRDAMVLSRNGSQVYMGFSPNGKEAIVAEWPRLRTIKIKCFGLEEIGDMFSQFVSHGVDESYEPRAEFVDKLYTNRYSEMLKLAAYILTEKVLNKSKLENIPLTVMDHYVLSMKSLTT